MRHPVAYTDGVLAPVIDVVAVSKRFGDVLAVDRVSVRVDQGEIYALLGLNGAGKSTLIRMLLGMVSPTGGTVAMFGGPVGARADALWARVGYLLETPAAYPELTVRENLDVVRRWRRLADNSSVDAALERLGLTAYAHRRACTLSLGNAQRLGLAKALLHRPDLLILDEPANGLDPAGVVEVRELLHELARAGTTVFLSSHVLAEVARLATRIGIIDGGRLVHEFPAVELDHRVRRWLEIATRDDAAARSALAAAGFTVDNDGHGLRTSDQRAVNAPDEVASLLVSAGCPLLRLVVEREDLETYFLRVVAAAHA
jgi:ABC-2 type transport system ATP-binding protein